MEARRERKRNENSWGLSGSESDSKRPTASRGLGIGGSFRFTFDVQSCVELYEGMVALAWPFPRPQAQLKHRAQMAPNGHLCVGCGNEPDARN